MTHKTMDQIIVLFGATGDLTQRKLLPALIRLRKNNEISVHTRIIAVGRKDFDTVQYVRFVRDNAPEMLDPQTLFAMVDYIRTDINDPNDYQRLKDHIAHLSGEQTITLYYFAVSPSLFPVIARNIQTSRLVVKGDAHARIIFEKPFGNDLLSATLINHALYDAFDESQIYRIDHYLGKEMIQNLLTVRFANRIFEDVWHNRTIKNVKIVVKETDGILNRGSYYDSAGALSDMVQSHLLQMMSLVAMDTPMSYHSIDVKKEKLRVLENVSFEPVKSLFGQYDGYLDEPDVDASSKTETFVFLKVLVNTPRFKGVPFYLMSGKKLESKQSSIIIEFEETSEQRKWQLPLSTNKLVIKIAPLDGVSLVLNSKVPGLRDNVEQVELDYCVACRAVGNMPEAYEKLLLEAFEGHKSLFACWNEIELSWRFIDSIRKIKQQIVIYQHPSQLYQLIKERTNEVL